MQGPQCVELSLISAETLSCDIIAYPTTSHSISRFMTEVSISHKVVYMKPRRRINSISHGWLLDKNYYHEPLHVQFYKNSNNFVV